MHIDPDGVISELLFQGASGSDFVRFRMLEIVAEDAAVEALVKTPEVYRAILTEIALRAGSFSYEAVESLYVGDLLAFAGELERLYETQSGSARFIGPDVPFSINLDVDATGHVALSGEILDLHGRNKLTFGFDMDQTSLVPVLKTLRRILAVALPAPMVG